jgi:hypothetical protein
VDLKLHSLDLTLKRGWRISLISSSRAAQTIGNLGRLNAYRTLPLTFTRILSPTLLQPNIALTDRQGATHHEYPTATLFGQSGRARSWVTGYSRTRDAPNVIQHWRTNRGDN